MSESVDAVTRLILSVFRLNGALLQEGDALVKDLGLTSARWQVLGAVTAAGGAATVPQIARSMGLSRQAVQRVCNDLESAGLVTYLENPHHLRSRLVGLTPAGRQAADAALARQQPWAASIVTGLSLDDLATTAAVVDRLADNLSKPEKSDGDPS